MKLRICSAPCAARAAALVCLVAAPSALASFPVVYDQGFPYANGTGRATMRVSGSDVFNNAFNGFSFGGGFGDYWNPFTLSGSLTGSGNTGGGIGGPPPAQVNTGGSFSSSFAESGVLTLSASTNSAVALIASAGPGEVVSGLCSGVFNFAFTVTEPIIAQWGASNATLKLNGNLLPIGGFAIWNLDPGVYLVEGGHNGSKYNDAGVHGQEGTFSASFTLTVGIPAPASLSALAFAGLAAARRRR